jgi:hypothetical protein
MPGIVCLHWKPIDPDHSVRAEDCSDCAELEALRDLEATARALQVKGYVGLFGGELAALDGIRAKRSGLDSHAEARKAGV